MIHRLLCLTSIAALVALSTSDVEARAGHARLVAHHHHRYAGVTPYPGAYGYSAPVDPRYGYEEAPYDPAYQGPGAEVFALTRQAQHEPGVTLELEPDAKQTATGGPVGGIPGRDGT